MFVVVPCYKESWATIKRTLMCAMFARVPPGCRKHIILGNDGHDVNVSRRGSSYLRGNAPRLRFCQACVCKHGTSGSSRPPPPLGYVVAPADAQLPASQRAPARPGGHVASDVPW